MPPSIGVSIGGGGGGGPCEKTLSTTSKRTSVTIVLKYFLFIKVKFVSYLNEKISNMLQIYETFDKKSYLIL